LLEDKLCPDAIGGDGGKQNIERLENMKHQNFSRPRYYLNVPMEVMEALMRKSGEMGFRCVGYDSAAYLVEALSQLAVEDLRSVLRQNDLLPGKESNG
jgi:hypothetical protein